MILSTSIIYLGKPYTGKFSGHTTFNVFQARHWLDTVGHGKLWNEYTLSTNIWYRWGQYSVSHLSYLTSYLSHVFVKVELTHNQHRFRQWIQKLFVAIIMVMNPECHARNSIVLLKKGYYKVQYLDKEFHPAWLFQTYFTHQLWWIMHTGID